MEKNNEVMIRVEGLKKSFGDLMVLNGIDTEIHKGEVLVLLGPSGSGKSTLLNIIRGTCSRCII